MSLRKLRVERGTDDLCRSRLVAVANGETSVEQTLINESCVAIGDGLVHPLAISDGPFPSTGHAAGIVETHHNRNRQIPGHIQTLENFHAHIEIGGALLDGVEVSEIREVAQMHLFETDAKLQ